MRTRKPSNHAELAYSALREMAKTFAFKPGERLNEVELAERLKMSRSPIREALNRLSTEGLLTWRPNHGFFCRQLRATEISSLCEVRIDLELGAIKPAIKCADKRTLRAIKASWQDVVARANALTTEALVGYDEEFHLALARASKNEERVRLLESINVRLNFVRRINLEREDRRRETFREHHAFIDAVIAGNVATAEGHMRRHLLLSAKEALDALPLSLVRIFAD
jgi:DNA-binding GntR family transcriptional regulator